MGAASHSGSPGRTRGRRPHCGPRGWVDNPRTDGDHRRMSSEASFAPTLLLAMPQLRDPNFVRSVVLLCEHGPNGAVGFVVNRPTDLRAAESVALEPPLSGDSGLMLWTGGPVEPQ